MTDKLLTETNKQTFSYLYGFGQSDCRRQLAIDNTDRTTYTRRDVFSCCGLVSVMTIIITIIK